MNRLDGRTVIVTGAASGIGSACVTKLRAEGAAVVAADLDTARIEEMCTESLRGVLPVAADVSDYQQTVDLIATASAAFAPLYGLIHCAGVRGVGTILTTGRMDWDRVIAINLTGTFNVCQAFARSLTSAGSPGAIVTVSSAAGIRAVPNRLSYAAAKHGVVGLTQTLALELAPHQIRANVIAPGLIRTPMTEAMFEDPATIDRIHASHPIGREGQPHEVADVASFLISDESSFITGAVLSVDGGHTIGIPSF
jgi:NAD(P)-dependent dehydrogenase (short-subunit alcohol dehydrogenase family)